MINIAFNQSDMELACTADETKLFVNRKFGRACLHTLDIFLLRTVNARCMQMAASNNSEITDSSVCVMSVNVNI